MYQVKEIDYETIYIVWRDKLWPGRVSPIRAMSSMQYLGGYNVAVYDLYTPTFWGLYCNDGLIGVNSGYRSTDDAYCSRGLWIDENHRGKGLSKLLFVELEKQALSEGCQALWSIPRVTSFPAYKSFGFEASSDWFTEGMEFGPNRYVFKLIGFSNAI